MTRYISTRGEAPELGFCDVMLTGLARDGGLYVPATWPQLSADTIAGFFGRPYWEVAVDVPGGSPVTGTAVALSDSGGLVVRTSNGEREVLAGDVRVRKS